MNTKITTGLLSIALIFTLFSWELLPETRTLAPIKTPTPYADSLSSDSQLSFQGIIPNLYVSYIANDGVVYGMSDHFVFVSQDGGATFERRGSLPKVDPSILDIAKNWIARTKFVRSLRTSSFPENMVVLDTGTILVFYDHIYRSTDGGWSFDSVHNFENENSGGQPFGGNAGTAVTNTGHVYFGEYLAESRPNTVSIVRSVDDGRTWDTAYQFHSGRIFHVHSLEYDSYRDRIWVFTGDKDHESHIMYTDDEFNTLQTIGGGSQMWRAVTGIPTPSGLIWGSDNDTEGGTIYRWHESDGRVDVLENLPGVVYFSTRTSTGSFAMSTTHEPYSEYTKRHNPPAETQLWVSTYEHEWSVAIRLESSFDPEITDGKKQRSSMSFTAGHIGARIFVYPFFTKRFQHATLVFLSGPSPGKEWR